tara:strand:+ start:114 stop:803 length:690 start_codon:yes stop_codon:yes gene_type:complete
MAERITRASCRLCQCEERDALEEELGNGIVTAKDLDKRMGWRENTSDRHFRNHMGEYHLGSNSECAVCTYFNRYQVEEDYYNGDVTSEAIAEMCGCSESTVYNHIKHHLKPLVQATAATAISLQAGGEMEALRSNVEKLNGELAHLFDNPDRNDPQFYGNLQRMHKETRETIKDILKIQEHAMGGITPEASINANTVNLIKIELAKESPEVWRRIRAGIIGEEEEDDNE